MSDDDRITPIDTQHPWTGGLRRNPPELPALDADASWRDLALRGAEYHAFIVHQWPLLVDEVVACRRAHRTSWVWPTISGAAVAIALVEALVLAGVFR